MAKVFKIEKVRKGRTEIIEGTLDELKRRFSYTFEIGYSWNKKINTNPKTIKSFVKNLRMSLKEKEGGTFTQTSINIID